MRQNFARNVDTKRLLDMFFISAIISLLGVRLYLELTGYPQIGRGEFHIAHMLWGGLLMSCAVILGVSYLGKGILRIVAIVGGIGFGVFIDELGKFITRDNDYFFPPTIGILYAVFVILYLAINFLGRKQTLTSREYQLNALVQLEEALNADMDEVEKRRVLELLDKADPTNKITRQLQEVVYSIEPTLPQQPSTARKLLKKIDAFYQKVWLRRSTHRIVRWFFIVELAVFVIGVVYALFNNFDSAIDFLSGDGDYGHSLVFGQLASTILATTCAIVGIAQLRRKREAAFEWFRRATLINLLLTEFFIFSRIEFLALPSFIFNLLLLIFVNFILGQERRLARERIIRQRQSAA